MFLGNVGIKWASKTKLSLRFNLNVKREGIKIVGIIGIKS